MYKKREVVEKLGIPSRRLQFITDSGLLSDTQMNPGRGRDRFYSRLNLLEILLIEELAKYGVQTGAIKDILSFSPIKSVAKYLGRNIESMEKNYGFELSGMYLVISQKNTGLTVQWFPDTYGTNKYPKMDMTDKTSVIVVNVGTLIKQVNHI